MRLPQAVAFDLDGTLTESFRPPAQGIADSLERLSAMVPIAVMSAGNFPRIEGYFTSIFEPRSEVRAFIFSSNAAEGYVWKNKRWGRVYQFSIAEKERARIVSVIKRGVTEANIGSERDHQILERDSNIAFAAVPLDASLDDRNAWDPDRSKRTRLKSVLTRELPEYEVVIGGPVSINITRKGINKAYGVRWLAQHLGIPTREMLFIGDALYEGGNDAVVIPTGIQTRETTGPEETAHIIEELLGG
ncbi:HAD-IIB family hydrolase [Candidatus Uhrbacteria bacterium]|nr:HAD-IIB family hydrolase [Candidatus Uhrbacteria bacterium]